MSGRILVADDNVRVLGLVGGILRSAGYEVDTVEGGGAAVEAASGNRFDLIVLDGMMPDVDGFEACEAIRRLPGHRHTPVLFLTGMTDDATFEDAIEVGADEVLAKPIRRSTLLLRVRSLLRVGALVGAQEQFQAEIRGITETISSLDEPLLRLREETARLAAATDLPPAAAERLEQLRAAEQELADRIHQLGRVIDGVAVVAPDPDAA